MNSEMLKAIQFLVSALLAIGGFMMQIPPEQATSNLSKWLSAVTDKVPPELYSPVADKWAAGALVAVALAVLLVPWLYRQRKKGRRPETGEQRHADKYPDLRVADSVAALELFGGSERRKLIALLEGGSIKAWARSMAKEQTPVGQDTDLLMLPSDVWSKHVLQHMPKRQQGTRAQTFLKTNDRGYSAFYDVWLNSVQMAELFPSFKLRADSVASSRVPLLEFVELAKNNGWDISGTDNLQILDLFDGLNQAGSDGLIQFWGRLNRNQFDSLARAERLIPIDAKHWVDFQVEPSAAITNAENFKTLTYDPRQAANRAVGGYIDLHLDREAAETWLHSKAKTFQGLRDARAKRDG